MDHTCDNITTITNQDDTRAYFLIWIRWYLKQNTIYVGTFGDIACQKDFKEQKTD